MHLLGANRSFWIASLGCYVEQQPLLRLPAVLRMTGLSRSSIYKLMAMGDFPASHKITRRAVAWCSTDVTQWVDARTSAHTEVRPKARPDKLAPAS